MFFIDKPYVSDFFKETVRDHNIPVVGTEISRTLNLYPGTKVISEAEAINTVLEPGEQLIYTTSENALGWIIKNLSFSVLVEKIEIFKDKVAFRELTRSIVPDFYFRPVKMNDLASLPYPDIEQPLVIKPATGFMSQGVHKVYDASDWDRIKDLILAERDISRDLYPPEVVNSSSLIIESCIKGEEYAMDAYFDSNGKPIILNILKHNFLHQMM